MPNLAKSPLAPLLGQHVPLRGPARLLMRSYARTRCQPGVSVARLMTRTGDNFDADLSMALEWQLWAFGGFEEHFAALLGALVKPGDRCIDVGANIGVHTVRMAKLAGERGEIIAIEPDTELAHRARRNIMLNQLSNARVIAAAATDRAGGQVVLYRPGAADTNKGRASLLQHAYLTGRTVTVPTVTVDGICDGPVALIKIDVEGHEGGVVAGAARTIARDMPAIIFEYAPELLAKQSESPFGWLAAQGYQMFLIRCVRNGVTGRRRRPVLEPVLEQPVGGGDILAIPAAMTARISALTT